MNNKDYKKAQAILEFLYENYLESVQIIKENRGKSTYTGDIGKNYLEIMTELDLLESEFDKYYLWYKSKEIIEVFRPEEDVRIQLNNSGALFYYNGGFKTENRERKNKLYINYLKNLALTLSLLIGSISLYRTFQIEDQNVSEPSMVVEEKSNNIFDGNIKDINEGYLGIDSLTKEIKKENVP